ncbi:Luc7-like protein 3 [Linnemannia elongata]|uniref:LUC7-domain-containing protein n=1 Tax=Linnemannia elongata AG-77 TaxID=1314771 RepID=A0A197KE55_9FUNG|nr:Luc7-like protein 3 [Linnemannia elongata]OAQ35992.1 LUC7-domain-containing protein [Linnemannia elongata AG-77]KAF9319855.1 Luc7-like protein 3 [Linnemannia elongata]KAG0064018.1 Luc7-like protein 3 [Linnemannia elongata]KAG0074180.1 Luc7-like protein 3 [Linnemannia elongata]
MTHNYARSLVSELFAPFEPSRYKFWDKEVCKHFLVKFCPNSLFTNTKSDLGNCDLVHDEKLREEYQKAPDRDTYRYEEEFFDYLTYLHNDLERKIRRGKERKDKEVDENLLNPRKDEKEEKMVMLEQKIKDTLAKVEEAGEEGRVEEAQVLTDQVEKMQADLQQLKQNDDVNPIFRQENKMEVCHVCGAFLVMNDTSNRLDSHLQGKQHTGYQKIHETYEEMKKQRGDRPHSSSSRGGRYRDDYGGSGPQREHYSDSRGDRDRGGYRDSRSYRDQPYRRDDRRDRDRDRDGGRRDRSRDRGGRRDYDRDRDYRRGGRDDRRF